MIVHRFTIGGYTDIELGVELQAGYDEPVLPGTRDRTLEIPGRHGKVIFGSDLEAREFNLPLSVIEPTSAAGLQTVIRRFAKVLLDNAGKPKDISLVFTKEPDKTYTVRYSGNIPLTRLIGGAHGEFTLPLIAADPYAYGEEVRTSTTITSSPQEMVVSNTGDYATPPVIIVTIAATSGDVTGFTLAIKQLK